MRRKILIVNDDADVLDLFEAMLSEHYAVIKACGGEECLSLLEKEKEKPDLILLSVVMPDVNGLTVLERMKQKEELKSIPVLLHTTVDLEAIRKKGINYIVKPVTKDELLSAVEKVFKARE